MSDAVIIAIVAAVPGVMSVVVTVLIFLKQTTQMKISKSTNHLVNGNMLAQLRLHARTARALAVASPNPINEAVAVLAEKEFQEHAVKKNAAIAA